MEDVCLSAIVSLVLMKQYLIYATTLAFVCLLGYIIWTATTEQPSAFFRMINSVPFGDKISHFLLVGLLTLLVNLSLRNQQVLIGPRKWLLGSMLVVVLITGEELSQALIPSRSLDAFDLLANYAGVFVFGYVAKYLTQQPAALKNHAT